MRAMSTRNDYPAHASRPFDRERDGFVLGEGAGILVIEEYEHARSRGASIYCELLGYGQSSDAYDLVAPDPDGHGVRLALATDLGYIPQNVQTQLKRCDLIMLESNHDLEMLRDGPYPWSVKQRVLSRVGHLSNDATSDFLERSYDGSAAHVILAHLSENNNHPDLARMAADRALAGQPSLLGNRLSLACQDEPMPSFCF